ncbi:hypothetical protein LT330_010484 [Penicillium expansum]|nr:hypothetical protein LT330_010484 [Penicillium expansum]
MNDTSGPSFTQQDRKALSDLRKIIADGSHAGGQILEKAGVILGLLDQIANDSGRSTVVIVQRLENRLEVLSEIFYNLSVAQEGLEAQIDFYRIQQQLGNGNLTATFFTTTDENFYAAIKSQISPACLMSTLTKFEPLMNSVILELGFNIMPLTLSDN